MRNYYVVWAYNRKGKIEQIGDFYDTREEAESYCSYVKSLYYRTRDLLYKPLDENFWVTEEID
mgnify:CR=1 FL=1